MPQNYFYRPSVSLLETAVERPLSANYIISEKKSEWDQAHELFQQTPEQGYIEPDLDKQNSSEENNIDQLEGGPVLADDQYDPVWPFPREGSQPKKKIWHIEDEFSQLKSAWESAGDNPQKIRIAHFDTGYDPDHPSCPPNIVNGGMQRNFLEGGTSAVDLGSEGWLNQKFHGIGTISILGGNTMQISSYGHNGYIGIHKNIEILPIRISRSVIQWKNKAFVDALNYIISLYDNPVTRCHIVTMSLGGMPSRAWADAVNQAYEKGIFIVTAAGNNFGRVTPSTLVYPARFSRVTAACGVTYDYTPYSLPGIHLTAMQGNYGPRKAMGNAIAAFTPNTAWAVKNQNVPISINGAGTSSATPQIAAAAGLYYQKYYQELTAMQHGWQRVETIREALFKTAERRGSDDDIKLYFGNGILKAADALLARPEDLTIEKAEISKAEWPFLKLITGAGFLEAEMEMYEVEILQLIHKSKKLQELLDHEEKEFDELSSEQQKEFYQTILQMEETSNALKQLIIANGLN